MDIGKLKNGVVVWVEGFAGDPETRVKVRHVNQDEYLRLRKLANEVTFDSRTHQKTENFNDRKWRELLVDAIVLDWEGFEEDGKPFPCTQENRHWLMEVSTDFQTIVLNAPLSLEKILALEREQQAKN